MTMTRRMRGPVIAGGILLGVALSVEIAETHKLVTSKYTYNEDVFPILRDRCGRCHVAGGVAPMSLMTYKEAYPWAESLRAELIAGHMPPWNAQDGIGVFRNAPKITAPEINTILTWASGGNPEGNPLKGPPEVTLDRDWPLGPPDLVLRLPSETTLAADTSETTQEFILATQTTEARWVRAVDLLPGTPSIVRNAVIALGANPRAEIAASGTAPEEVLGMWVPGEAPVLSDGGTRLPAGAELIVRIHYKKTYKFDGKAMTDRSAIGLYFGQAPATELRRFKVASPPVTTASGNRVTFSRTVDEDLQALAISPNEELSNARLEVDAVSPSGVRTAVIRLAVRPDWMRRYWFERPLALERGSRIEVVATLNAADSLLPPAASPTPPQKVDGTPIVVTFDVVPAQGR